jgi:hypothetical protein
VDKTDNKKQQEKNTTKGEKKGQGHRAKVERTGDKKNRKTNHRNIKQKKDTQMAGAAVSVTGSSGPSCSVQT